MNQNKKCEVCESYRGNPPPHVCPQAASPEESQEKAIKTVERLDDSCKDGCVHSPASSDWKEKLEGMFERGSFYMKDTGAFNLDALVDFIETLIQEDKNAVFNFQSGYEKGRAAEREEQNRISNSGRKLYQIGYDAALKEIKDACVLAEMDGEKVGWKEGQLHGEAVGRKAERDWLIALAENTRIPMNHSEQYISGYRKALSDFITQAKTNETK